jgi:hypothetical protein
MGEGIAAGYEALGILLRSTLGIGGKNWVFRASAFSDKVVAMPDSVTRLGIVGGVGGRWLCSFAHLASGYTPLLLFVVSATAYLKCTASAFLMAIPLALSASR